MKLYRYTFKKDDYSIGILTGLDDFFNIDEICECCWFFEEKLKGPDCDLENTKSYFTEKGNRKFNKAIKKIKKLAESKNIEFICEILENFDINNVVYQDENQVILKVI